MEPQFWLFGFWSLLLAEAERYLCMNGGTPHSYEKFFCSCAPKFTGVRCEMPVCIHGFYSSELPLENRRSIAYPICYCEEGWSGKFCDIPQCMHGTVRKQRLRHHKHNATGDYSCKCKRGYEGERCQDVVECNHGSPQWDTYKFASWCQCLRGWGGAFCDQIVCFDGFPNSSDSCVCRAGTQPPHCVTDAKGWNATASIKSEFPWTSFGKTLLFVALLIAGVFVFCVMCSRLCSQSYEESAELLTPSKNRFERRGRDPRTQNGCADPTLTVALL